MALDEGEASRIGYRFRRRRSIDGQPRVCSKKEHKARLLIAREHSRRIARL